MSNKVWKLNKYCQLLALSAASACLPYAAQAADAQFNDALRAANSGNIALLQQYQYAMQNDALGYYPEYWILNSSLASQPADQIAGFAQRYPQSAMAEKLAADYVEEKVKQADFTAAQQAFMRQCVTHGYAVWEGSSFRLTPAGMVVQNAILEELI